MSSAAEILVIIVSSILSLFLIVGVILAIYLIKLTSEIRKIAKTTESTVRRFEDIAGGVSKFTSPLFVLTFLKNAAGILKKKGK